MTHAKHSELSASGAHQWWNCAGSVTATRGIPRVDSIYAEEGTAAHELARRCLVEGHDTEHYQDQTIEGFRGDASDGNAVQIYVDVCRRLQSSCDVHFIERSFSLEALHPPVPMFGTSDFVSYVRRSRELHVVDLKFGKGVLGEREGQSATHDTTRSASRWRSTSPSPRSPRRSFSRG